MLKAFIALVIISSANSTFAKATKLKWDEFKAMDIKTKKIKSKKFLKTLKGDVQVAGFMIPVDFDDKTIKEFVLLPVPPGCMHIPPPDQNQMILVKVPKGKTVKYEMNPIWVTGKVKALDIKSIKKDDDSLPYYEMTYESSNKYDYKKEKFLQELQ